MSSPVSTIYNNTVTPVQVTPLSSSGSSATPGISFGDVLDAINPLQHIPVISSIYRAVSGNPISAGSQIVGDTMYGGILGIGSAISGLATSLANVAVQNSTGTDISQHVVAAMQSITGSSTAPASAIPATPLAPAANTQENLQSAVALANTPRPGAISDQVSQALQTITHSSDSTQKNAQYARVQAFDAMHKSLMKIKI